MTNPPEALPTESSDHKATANDNEVNLGSVENVAYNGAPVLIKMLSELVTNVHVSW